MISSFGVRVLWSAAVLASAANSCLAVGSMPVARRTGGVLVSDTTLDAVYLLRDLDCNGTATGPDEAKVYFDASNASGVPSPTGSIFSIAQADDGTVYLGDGDTDSVYACKDLNNDGDALDAGEARLYFSSLNASLLTLPTPNGLAVGPDGAVYISNAGTATSPQDGIIRTLPVDGDGNANGPGEQVLYVDETTIGVTSAAPFDCCVLNGDVYFVDSRGSASDVILRAHDGDGNGSIDAAELTTYFNADGTYPFPLAFSCQTDGTSIFVHESTSSQVQTVWRLADGNGSNSINDVSEGTQVWSETSLPSGTTMSNSFSIGIGPRKLAISSNGTDPNDEVIIATDLNNDGDFNDAGGTTILAQGVAGTSFPENIRTVSFYGAPCAADVNSSGSVTVQDIFDFLGFYFSNNLRADVNASCSVSVQDIFDFLSLYFAGC